MHVARRVPSPAALTFALVACAYALGLCPSLYWLDSGELAAAGFELGIAHAPGHPLAALLFKLFQLLPVGDLAMRAGLSQALCGAGAAALVAALGARLAARFVEDALAADLLGVAAALLYAASYAAAFQAVRVEVYALSSVLVLATLAGCARFAETGQPGALGLAGLCFGLGLANHHYLTLLGAGPAGLALVLPRGSELRAALPRAIGGVVVGLSLYVYLPLRAAHEPVVAWGLPRTLGSFLWVVSARSFQRSAGTGTAGDLPDLFGALLDQLTPLAALLALGGLYFALRRAPHLGVALALALLGPIVGRVFVPFDPGNPDAYAYLGTGIAALALLCVPLVALLVEALPARARRPAAGGVLALVLVRAVLVAPSLSLRGFDETRAVFAPLLERLPGRAVVVPSYFQTSFALAYLRVVEEARPDLAVIPRHFLDHPGVRAALLAREPELAPALGERDLAENAPAILEGLSRTLVLEHDVDLSLALARHASVVPVEDGGQDLQTRRFALWQATLHLHQICTLGSSAQERTRAEAIVKRLGGDPPSLGGVLAACRASSAPVPLR